MGSSGNVGPRLLESNIRPTAHIAKKEKKKKASEGLLKGTSL